MKKCSQCAEIKAFGEFNKDRQKPDGKSYICKVCDAMKSAARRRAHPGAVNKAIATWQKKNPAKFRAYKAKWRAANVVSRATYNAAWVAGNRDRHNAKGARRRAAELQATPAWANEFYIAEIYDLAQRRSKSTGVHHNVDHIVPLRSKLVCGLHCEHNLQVIPAPVNKSKGNHHWPHMPEVRM